MAVERTEPKEVAQVAGVQGIRCKAGSGLASSVGLLKSLSTTRVLVLDLSRFIYIL